MSHSTHLFHGSSCHDALAGVFLGNRRQAHAACGLLGLPGGKA